MGDQRITDEEIADEIADEICDVCGEPHGGNVEPCPECGWIQCSHCWDDDCADCGHTMKEGDGGE